MTSIGSYYVIYGGELYHYGVKGMKWGVRKSPNKKHSSKKRRAKINLQLFGNKDLERQTPNQLRKTIKSLKKQIARHVAKIASPESYDVDWNTKSPAHKAGLIHHWTKEIKNMNKTIHQAEDCLKKLEDDDNG